MVQRQKNGHLLEPALRNSIRLDRGCEGMLSVISRNLQVLVDHVKELEDRLLNVESSARASPAQGDGPELITAGAVRIDHSARRVFMDNREVPLSPIEYRLIYQLAVNSGRVVLHRDLMRKASVHGEVSQGNLKVYIGRLRAKLNRNGGSTCELRAVRGVGYRLSA